MLRPVVNTDIAILFNHQLDSVSNWLVAFTHPDPTDEAAFTLHMAKVLKDETVTMRTIVVDDQIAGYVTKYEIDGEPQIGFVLDREFWGKGIATKSVSEFLLEIKQRPLFARTAFDNHASMKVLEKLGFIRTSEGLYFSNARGAEIVEVLWTLP